MSIDVIEQSNTNPVLSWSPAASINVWSLYSFTPTLTDPDSNTWTYSILRKPSWASFSTVTWTLSWTPLCSDYWYYSNIEISVNDWFASDSLDAFDIDVELLANNVPTITWTVSTTWTEWVLYSSTFTGNDVDDCDTLTYAWINLPDWLTLSSTWKLSWIPTSSSALLYTGITISVGDWRWWTWTYPEFSINITITSEIELTNTWTITTKTWSATLTWITSTFTWYLNSYSWGYIKYWISWSSLDTRLSLSWTSTSAYWIFFWLTSWIDYEYMIFVEDINWNTATSAVLSFQTDKLEFIGTWSWIITDNTKISFSWIWVKLYWTDNNLALTEIKYSTNSWLILSWWWTWFSINWPITNLSWSLTWLEELEFYYYKIYINDSHWNQLVSEMNSFQATSTIGIDISSTWTLIVSTGSVVFEWISVSIFWIPVNSFSWAYIKYSTNSWELSTWIWLIVDLIWSTSSLSWSTSNLTSNTVYYYVIYANDTDLVSPTISTSTWGDMLSFKTANSNPTIEWPDIATWTEWVLYELTFTWNDIDFWDEITYSISWILPDWLSFSSTSWILTWIPVANSSGVYTNIVVSVLDSNWWSASLDPFDITIFPSNSITLNSTWILITTTWSVSFTWITLTVRWNSNSYSWWYIKYWISWSSLDMRVDLDWPITWLYWTISSLTDWTAYQYQIFIEDSRWVENFSTVFGFTTDLVVANNPPTITAPWWITTTWKEWVLYQTMFVGSDIEANWLTYSVSWTLPSWITFTAPFLSWTPAVYSAGVYPDIAIIVTDGDWASTSSELFTITIAPMDMITLDSIWTLTQTIWSASITWVVLTVRWNSNGYSWWYIKYWLSWSSLDMRSDLNWPITWAYWNFPSLIPWSNYQYQIIIEDNAWNSNTSSVLGFQSDKLEFVSTWSWVIRNNTQVLFSWINVKVLWTNNNLALTQIKYSTSSWLVAWWWWSWFDLTWLADDLVWSKIWLDVLTTYYYKIYITDLHWNPLVSDIYNFTTPWDPVIGSISNWWVEEWTWSVIFTWMSVYISWLGNEFSWAYIKYNTDSWALALWSGTRSNLSWTAIDFSWSILSGLNDNTRYYYIIYVDDTSLATPTKTSSTWASMLYFETKLITWISWLNTNYELVDVKIHWDWLIVLSSESWSVTFDVSVNIVWYEGQNGSGNDINYANSFIKYWKDPTFQTYSTTWLTLAPTPLSSWWGTDIELTATADNLWTWNYVYQAYLEDTYWNISNSDTWTFSIVSQLVPANWIIISSIWTIWVTDNSISILWASALVASWVSANYYSWGYIEYWETLWLWKRIELDWFENRLSWLIPWLNASTNIYYRIILQDTDLSTNDYISEIYQITTTSHVPTTPNASGWGSSWWSSSWWGWGSSAYSYCKTNDFALSLDLYQSTITTTWYLDMRITKGLINRPVIMADCSSTYRVEIKDETVVSNESGQWFNWKIWISPLLLRDFPSSDSIKVIKWFKVWWIRWETLNLSKKYKFTSSVYLSKWMDPDKVKLYFVRDWKLSIAWDWWELSSNNKFISVYLDKMADIVLAYDSDFVESLHGSSPWCWSINNTKAPFTDIYWHWWGEYIKKAYWLWIVEWETKDRFYPNAFITRAELVKISVKAFCLDVPKNLSDKPFEDVELNYWYANYIAAWKINNIIDWYLDESVRPNNNVVRAESLKILLAAAWYDIWTGSNVTEFQDVLDDKWYYSYVAFAEKLWVVEWYTIPEIVPVFDLIDSFLFIWDRSEGIKSLQYLLKSLWFINFEPSGYYWPSTQSALARYLSNKWIMVLSENVDWVQWPTEKVAVEELIAEFKRLNIRWEASIYRPASSITRAEAVKVLMKLVDKVYNI